MTYQLAPPDKYRLNISKKAIQFWKDHFISVFSGFAAIFPLHLWCQVIPQAENKSIMTTIKCQKNISSYAHLHGNHDYPALPFVPSVMEALIHEKPSRSKTWDEHAVKGWVLGTLDEHYCCWCLWVQKTIATRISGMVFFKHKYI